MAINVSNAHAGGRQRKKKVLHIVKRKKIKKRSCEKEENKKRLCFADVPTRSSAVHQAGGRAGFSSISKSRECKRWRDTSGVV
jgi:hypothetical protein